MASGVGQKVRNSAPLGQGTTSLRVLTSEGEFSHLRGDRLSEGSSSFVRENGMTPCQRDEHSQP